MSTEDGKAAPADTPAADAAKRSWAGILDVERPSLTERPPEALTNPPFALKASVVVYALALVAMIVAIAMLKAPGG